VNAGNTGVVAERLSWASDALHAAAAASAAHRLGVLAALESGPVRVNTLARACQTDVRSTGVLLDGLLAMGLVSIIDDGRFRVAVPHLSALGAVSASGDLLIQAIRSGRAPMECDVPSGATRTYPDAVSYLAALLANAAAAVADVLGEPTSSSMSAPAPRYVAAGAWSSSTRCRRRTRWPSGPYGSTAWAS
jgi:hypothetical protein